MLPPPPRAAMERTAAPERAGRAHVVRAWPHAALCGGARAVRRGAHVCAARRRAWPPKGGRWEQPRPAARRPPWCPR
eukprot:230092-Prymnesium_polylepis.1